MTEINNDITKDITDPQEAHLAWSTEQTPERMAQVVSTLKPMINVEIQRYAGPKTILRNRAKQLAIKAVKNYDPASGAKLSSWVVTQLQPLNRYSKKLTRPVQSSEVAIRQAAEVERRRVELTDELGSEPTEEQLADTVGLSIGRLQQLRRTVRPIVTEGQITESAEGGSDDFTFPGVNNTGTDPVLKSAVEMIYSDLGERDKQIFELKTGYGGKPVVDNMTIAKRLGISPGLVSQRSLDITNRIMGAYNNVG